MTLPKKHMAMFMVFGVIAVTAPGSRAQFITVAPFGPSGYSGETVYGPPFGPPPFTGPGATPILLPPPLPNPAMPPGTYIVDALSSGTEAGNAYLFSVALAPGAVGAPGSPVAFQVGVGTAPSQFVPGPPALGPLPPEAAGDMFLSSVNFGTGLPHPTFGVPALAGVIPAGTLIGADEFALGLNCGPPVGFNDNLNGLMLRVPVGGFGGMYYSLAAAGLGPGFYGPADIISPALPLGAPWATALGLGLGPGDDIDALIVQDLSPALFYTPGVDFVVFSLTPASPTLGLIGAGPGDLLLAPFVGPPGVFIPAAALGLAPGDNLDALDVIFIDRCSNTNPPTPPTKWIQLPDLTNGITVRASAPRILADDFRCTLTGPITDIHLWGAWLSNFPTVITNFHISFHEDIPVSISNLFSRPGAELWSTNFSAGQYTITPYTNAPESFYDPNVGAIIGADSSVFRYDFWIEPCRAFVQTNGVIYWMDVQAYHPNTGPFANRVWGWKSSTEHCYDDAVWGNTPMPAWNELRYPSGPLTNQSFDLAFELTTQVPFSQWQIQYFGSVTNIDAAASADPDGDGMSNTNEYLAGTVATNAASSFRIVSIERQSVTNVSLAWTTVGCHSYVVQTNRPVTIAGIPGNFTNDWSDLSSAISVPGTGSFTNTLVHVGGIPTNRPALYYRVRMLCP